MMAYIEREAAIRSVSEWYRKALHPDNKSQYNEGERAAYRTALSEIAKLPAADVAPVRHGRWIVDDITGLAKCSDCKNDAPLDTTGGVQWCSPFCHSCGAKMDGSEEVR